MKLCNHQLMQLLLPSWVQLYWFPPRTNQFNQFPSQEEHLEQTSIQMCPLFGVWTVKVEESCDMIRPDNSDGNHMTPHWDTSIHSEFQLNPISLWNCSMSSVFHANSQVL